VHVHAYHEPVYISQWWLLSSDITHITLITCPISFHGDQPTVTFGCQDTTDVPQEHPKCSLELLTLLQLHYANGIKLKITVPPRGLSCILVCSNSLDYAPLHNVSPPCSWCEILPGIAALTCTQCWKGWCNTHVYHGFNFQTAQWNQICHQDKSRLIVTSTRTVDPWRAPLYLQLVTSVPLLHEIMVHHYIHSGTSV